MQATPHLPRLLDRLRGKLSAKTLARQTLGRPALEVGVSQPAAQERFNAASLDGVLAAGVVLLPAAGDLAHQGVEQGIARARLETDDSLDLAARGQEHHPRKTSEMNQDTTFRGVGKEH